MNLLYEHEIMGMLSAEIESQVSTLKSEYGEKVSLAAGENSIILRSGSRESY